jgi:hypothetical protein
LSSAAVAGDKPAGKYGEFSDMTDLGIDRANPLVAPAPFEEWKESGHSNVAAKDWKAWEDIDDEHLKHFQVKLNPKVRVW